MRIVVVGAGIVGVATAIHLKRAGEDVVLVDRTAPAAGASFGNGGVLASCSVVPVTVPGLPRKAPGMLVDPDGPLFLRWSYLPRLLPWLARYLRHCNAADVRRIAAGLLPIIGDSVDEHRALSEGTPAAHWLRETDYVFAYADRAAFARDAFAWSIRRELGFRWTELDGAALRDYDPALGESLGFAAAVPGHGLITDPGRYVGALADHFVMLGGTVREAEVVDAATEEGAVRAAILANGERIACDALVVAAGAWSKPLARRLGVDVPLESERGYHIEFERPSLTPRSPTMFAAAKFVASPMQGRLRCAGIVEFGGLAAKPSEAPFRLLERRARAALPGLEFAAISRWMGHRPATADSLPVIGEVPGRRGAFLAFGHHHVGLTGGAKTGRLVADLVRRRPPNIDLAPYDPGRWARRSSP